MEELFRFMLTRPAQRADETRTIPMRLSAAYHDRLRQARNSAEPRAQLKNIALAQRGSPQALKSLDELKYGEALRNLLAALASGSDMSPGQLAASITNVFGGVASTVVADPDFARDRERLCDALVTTVILGNDGPVSSDAAVRALRAKAIVERVAAGDSQLAESGAIAEALQRTVLLPDDLFPLPGGRQRGGRPGGAPAVDDRDRRRAELVARCDGLRAAYTRLTRITPEDLVVPEAPGATPSAPGAPSPTVPPERPGGRRGGEQPSATASVVTAAAVASAPLLLKPAVVRAFDTRERDVLAERNLDLTRVGLPAALDRLSTELQEVELELAELDHASRRDVIRVGASFLPQAVTAVGDVVAGSPAPTTYGTVAPAGIGDLLVVRQFLKGYEARELAHVENVLKGEYKERMHRRAVTTEETFTTETETKREEERDQQSTERFELKTEASQVQKEDMSLKVGVAVTAKYGPSVEFKGTTDFALNQSKEEATKIATSYSKDVTTRAVSKIFERRREERILKTTQVFEEKNTHGVDNKTGAEHVVGQYQWIDKVYEAQVFNYGKRLLFDIMLPEPAAFLLYALGNQPKAGAALVKPVPFELKPTDISEWNYTYYVKQYEVVGVEPPPQPYISVAKVLEGAGAKDGSTKTLEIAIKDGYQAIHVSVRQSFTMSNASASMDVIVGEWIHRFTQSDGWAWSYTLSNEVGSVPVAIVTGAGVEVFADAFEIHCQRTPRALDEWRLKTHTSILQAYQKQLRDYEEKLAALETQTAQQVFGRNPLDNERLIRTELKKGTVSVLTAQHYELFGAIVVSQPEGYPQPDLAEADAEGRYIRFFEQAFEWEQMMFFYYPYFWGRKPNWVKAALLQDTDPLFAEFIKAGAARVVVSVRPGFESAVGHFLESGELWDGGDLPPITSPLYLSIIEEIKERDKAAGGEVPQGDPWEVHLPTTLIKLRDQASLPEWQKNDKGEWVPV